MVVFVLFLPSNQDKLQVSTPFSPFVLISLIRKGDLGKSVVQIIWFEIHFWCLSLVIHLVHITMKLFNWCHFELS